MGHDVVSPSNLVPYINPRGVHESIFHGSARYSIRINFCPPGTSIKVQFVNVIQVSRFLSDNSLAAYPARKLLITQIRNTFSNPR